MRFALLLIVALSAHGASAQSPDARSDRLGRTETAIVVAVGAASAVLVPMDDDLTLRVLAAPALSGLAVYGVGRALGGRGRLVPTLAGAAAGSLPAIALFAVANGLNERDGFWLYVAGSAASVAGPAIGATVGFDRSRVRLAPVAVRGPGGERAAGLSLRLGL